MRMDCDLSVILNDRIWTIHGSHDSIHLRTAGGDPVLSLMALVAHIPLKRRQLHQVHEYLKRMGLTLYANDLSVGLLGVRATFFTRSMMSLGFELMRAIRAMLRATSLISIDHRINAK